MGRCHCFMFHRSRSEGATVDVATCGIDTSTRGALLPPEVSSFFFAAEAPLSAFPEELPP